MWEDHGNTLQKMFTSAVQALARWPMGIPEVWAQQTGLHRDPLPARNGWQHTGTTWPTDPEEYHCRPSRPSPGVA